MAKSLGQLIQKDVPATINFGDGDIYHIRFKPHENLQKEATELQDRLDSAEGDAEATEATRQESYQSFCRTVTSWDLLDEDKKPIQLTPEGLSSANCGPDSKGVPPALLTTFLLRAYEQHFSIKVGGRRN
jgi:hypothetical protein